MRERPDSARELMKALEEIDAGEDWGEADLERWWSELPPQITGTIS